MAVESVEIVLNGVDNASPVVDKVSQKLIANEDKYISKLREQLIAQTQGAEAAERFKLAEMGFSEAAIESAVALKQQIEAAKEAARAQDELEKQTREATEAQQEQAGAGGGGFGQMAGQAQEFGAQLKQGFGTIQQFIGPAEELTKLLTGQVAWQMKMNRLMDDHQRQVDFNLKKKQEDLDVQIQIANLQSDEATRREMLLNLQSQMTDELAAQRALVDQMNQTSEDAAGSFGGRLQELAEYATMGFYNNNEDEQIVQNILEEERKRLAALEAQKEQLDEQLKTENEQLRIAREKAEAEQRRAQASKTAEEELNRMRAEIRELNDPGENERRRVEEMFNAEGVTDAQRMELENLQATRAEAEERFRVEQEGRDEMRAAIEATRQAERDAYAEMKKAIEDTQKAMQQQAERDEDYLNNLRQRNIELTQGKEAAAEFAAAQRGVSEEAIAQGRAIAEQNKQLEEQAKLEADRKKEEEKAAKASPSLNAPQLQAMQSRLLSRSGQSNLGERQAKASEKVAELTVKIETLQRDHSNLLEDIRNNTRNTIRVVS